MHNAIIAIVFIGMLIAPCIVTMFKGSEEEI
ncbi:hypothetical protein SAMN05421771_0067 [Granulicella pectinivorans]|jgi:hypothetical protein|uniref:Uncharacterized protein n=1 Tax=Granulicella pectinivorans TaxID=474950 RepID=A0A1I6L0F8_9BACT|nr:hypothetical protein SAMN05421771_0067 [Granulicella pectinivorans]